MNTNLIHELRKVLLENASKKVEEESFVNLVGAILNVFKCSMCTLWSINNNSTSGRRKDISPSISMIARKLKDGLEYCFKDKDFVIELKDTFIEKTIMSNEPYYVGDKLDNKNQDCISALDLNYFIGISIPDFDNSEKKIAVLKLSFMNNPGIEFVELANIIRDYISSLLYKHTLLKKQDVMNELMKNYEKYGQKRDLAGIFSPILKTILPKYCDYEGASFFVWNSYRNHFTLLDTITKIEVKINGQNKYQILDNKRDYPKVFYQSGDGLTGLAAKKKMVMMYDDLEYEDNNPDYWHKSREITAHPGKTMMVIPIFRPSKKDDIIGILRLINKKNPKDKNVVDQFNDIDEELISYASKYLALIIDYFLGEEERNDFISKLSHEFSTPANSIRITADRLIKGRDNTDFMNNYFNSYMESILNCSELQIQQAKSNLYVSKMRFNLPKSERYIISRRLLKDVISKSRKTVIPIARDADVWFENIVIDKKFPFWSLYIDISAFETVFYNLLTNAIKYRDPEKIFYVFIRGYNSKDKQLIIEVTDNGLGIAEEDKENIFLWGKRGKEVTERDTNGFGVGLAVIKQIITDFGGEINIKSLQSPTTFEIILPSNLLENDYTQTDIWKK